MSKSEIADTFAAHKYTEQLGVEPGKILDYFQNYLKIDLKMPFMDWFEKLGYLHGHTTSRIELFWMVYNRSCLKASDKEVEVIVASLYEILYGNHEKSSTRYIPYIYSMFQTYLQEMRNRSLNITIVTAYADYALEGIKGKLPLELHELVDGPITFSK